MAVLWSVDEAGLRINPLWNRTHGYGEGVSIYSLTQMKSISFFLLNAKGNIYKTYGFQTTSY